MFARNERYFRKDTNGVALPYLDRIIVEIVQDQNARRPAEPLGQDDLLLVAAAEQADGLMEGRRADV